MSRATPSNLAVIALAVMLNASSATARPSPLSTAFTYQGELKLSGNNLNSTADFQFTLWDALSGGSTASSTIGRNNIAVVDGLFTVEIDFGSDAFNGDARWLEIAVRSPAGSGSFTPLSPRQPLTAAPYSLQTRGIFVDNSGKVGIGTTTPFAKLDVNGGLSVFDSANQNIYLATDLFRITNTGNEDTVYQYLYPADTHTFYTGGTERMTIAANGNVGIGVIAPAQPLHVAGNARIDGWIGTDIDQPVEIYANNKRVWRAYDATDITNKNSPNIIAGHAVNTVEEGVVGATISGGGMTANQNYVSANFGTIGGGLKNTITGVNSTVGGGFENEATGASSVVSGGSNNSAVGHGSAVPGGVSNIVEGLRSFAAGYHCLVLHDGAFMWNDSSRGFRASTGENEFTARAAGGFKFYTNPDANLGAKLDPNATSWSSICDRNVKRDITPIDPREIVQRLAAIPISTWTYKDDASATPHMGPMAQDFHAAFGLGNDDKFISTLDADGVALAAIQGLHQLVKDKDTEIAELRDRLAALEAAFNKERSQ